MTRRVMLAVGLVAVVGLSSVPVRGQDLTTRLSYFLKDLYAGTLGITVPITAIRVADGTAAAPSYTFVNAPTYGFYSTGSNSLRVSLAGTQQWAFASSTFFGVSDASAIALGSASDTTLSRPAAGKITLTGTGAGSAVQIRGVQGTVPTCATNCGTSATVAGTDMAGIVTMGASGVPASAWVVTFNGTWTNAPACTVQSALASMVVGKMPIAVVTTTTTITVTTNGTAPATSDKYAYTCFGV